MRRDFQGGEPVRYLHQPVAAGWHRFDAISLLPQGLYVFPDCRARQAQFVRNGLARGEVVSAVRKECEDELLVRLERLWGWVGHIARAESPQRTNLPPLGQRAHQTPGFSTSLASFPGPRGEGELLELERALGHAVAARFQRQLNSNDPHRRRESQLVYQRPLLVHAVSRLDADTLRKRSCGDATGRPEVGDFVVLGRGSRYDVGPRMPNLDRLFEEVAFFVAQSKPVYRQVGTLVVDVVAVAAIEDLHSPLASITQKVGVVRPMIPDRQRIVVLG